METSNKSPTTGELQENVCKGEVSRYIHYVSQVKNGRYFDFQIQTKKKPWEEYVFPLQKSSGLQSSVKVPH